MQSFWQSTLLLADRSRIGNFGTSFRGHAQESNRDQVLTGLLVVAGLVVGVWLLSRLLVYREKKLSRSSPLRLFFGLCKAHDLGWSERLVLWRWTRLKRLKDPARVFLEATLLDHVERSGWSPRQVKRLKELRRRLYGVTPAARPAKEPPREQRNTTGRAAPPAVKPTFPQAASPSLDIPPWTPGPTAGV
jgi:hypothetical protein